MSALMAKAKGAVAERAGAAVAHAEASAASSSRLQKTVGASAILAPSAAIQRENSKNTSM